MSTTTVLEAPLSMVHDPGQSPVILVVDDSPAIREALIMMLEDLGHTSVRVAEDGVAALEIIRGTPCDLVLLDIEMPRLNGFGVLDALKRDSFLSQLPIIVTSGLDELDAVARCIELGAEDFLHKPVNPILLRARIDASLERKRLRDRERHHHEAVTEQKRLLEIEQKKTERLMLNILPRPIAERLKNGELDIAERYPAVTILFADLVNFTGLASHMDPEALVRILNTVFSRFDRLTKLHGLEKIKTIGDCYMVAGGLPIPCDNHAIAVASMAIDMIDAIHDVNKDLEIDLDLRIGINSGPVVAGVIGRMKFAYDLWGHTVNLASRMESSGLPGRIQVSDGTRQLLDNKFTLTERGTVECKGIGGVRTYFLSR